MLYNLELNTDYNDNLLLSSGVYGYQGTQPQPQTFEFADASYWNGYQLWDQNDMSPWSDFHSWNWQNDLVYPPLYATGELPVVPQRAGYNACDNYGFDANANAGLVSTTYNTGNMLSNSGVAAEAYGYGDNVNATGYGLPYNANANSMLPVIPATTTPNGNNWNLRAIQSTTSQRNLRNKNPKSRSTLSRALVLPTKPAASNNRGTHRAAVRAVSPSSRSRSWSSNSRNTPARHEATIMGARDRDFARTMDGCPECGVAAGGMRLTDFQRHLRTHCPEKVGCLGRLVGVDVDVDPGGLGRSGGSGSRGVRVRVRVGGCGAVFSRKDGLKRHLLHSEDCLPDAEMFPGLEDEARKRLAKMMGAFG